MGITCSRELRGLSSPDSTKPQDGKRDCPPFSESSMFTLGIMVRLSSVLMASFIPGQKWMRKAIKDADPYTSHPPWWSDDPLLPRHPTFPDAHQACVSATQSAPPPGHNLSIPLGDSEKRHRWDPAHLHTFPSVIPVDREDGGKGRTVAMPGTPQSKPCVASIKACTLAHSPAYFPKLTVPPANEWYPSTSSVLNQVRLVRGIQFNGT